MTSHASPYPVDHSMPRLGRRALVVAALLAAAIVVGALLFALAAAVPVAIADPYYVT